MANTTKPAVKDRPAKEKPAAKPAASKPAVQEGITLKDMAAELGRSERSTRASIRRALGGPQVGQGGRYRWKSKNDPEYKKLVKLLTAPASKETSEGE
jgi:pyruvate/2-oxoglutarate dehydrogenase complex dihydrolipoamide acyltransferase (E2) component